MDSKPALSLKSPLVGLFIGVGIFVAVITGAIVYLVVAEVNQITVQHSDVYRLAVGRIKANPSVALALGEPLSFGKPESIIAFTNLAEFGQAHFAIPVSGARSSGRAHIVAGKQDGVWVFEQLTVTTADQAMQIDLLEAIR